MNVNLKAQTQFVDYLLFEARGETYRGELKHKFIVKTTMNASAIASAVWYCMPSENASYVAEILI